MPHRCAGPVLLCTLVYQTGTRGSKSPSPRGMVVPVLGGRPCGLQLASATRTQRPLAGPLARAVGPARPNPPRRLASPGRCGPEWRPGRGRMLGSARSAPATLPLAPRRDGTPAARASQTAPARGIRSSRTARCAKGQAGALGHLQSQPSQPSPSLVPCKRPISEAMKAGSECRAESRRCRGSAAHCGAACSGALVRAGNIVRSALRLWSLMLPLLVWTGRTRFGAG